MNEDSNFGNIPSHDHSFSDSHDYLSRAQYAVVTESVEDAYRRSVAKDCFCAVRTDDVYMRLSNFHELDSPEYKAIEETIMKRFHRSMDNIDDLLKED